MVVVLLVGGFVLGGRVLDVRERGAVDDAVRDAATAYVDLIATGGRDDLEQLWSMTASTDPTGLRAAGDFLIDADERIEVIEVGEPQAVKEAGTPYPGVLEDFRRVEVRYRLASNELHGQLVLGHLEGRSGSSVEDWRVVRPLTGALGWQHWNPSATLADLYVGGHLHAGDPVRVGSDDDADQPLYPAVYGVEMRIDPWYVSPEAKVSVGAGEPRALLPMVLQATDATARRTRELVAELFKVCGTDKPGFVSCPARDIVEATGVDIFEDRRWWRGLVEVPTITFNDTGFTMTDGVFGFVGPEGEHRVRFKGTGAAPISNNDGQLFVSGVTIEEVS